MPVTGAAIAKGTLDASHMRQNTIEFTTIMILADYIGGIAIDSTGVKASRGRIQIHDEMVKHLKSAVLTAFADTPSATDASVDVELYNYTDGQVVAKITYAGEGGYKEATIDADTIKALVGKQIGVRLNVTTASATSGASQTFYQIALILILGIS